MKKDKHSSLLKSRIQDLAFNWLQYQNIFLISEHAKGKELNYTYSEMAEYLGPDVDMSIEEKKRLLKFRGEDIPVKANI